MTGAGLWLTLIGMGAVTYAIRLSFIVLWGRVAVPPGVQRALRFVPPAVLSAIIFPEILRHTGGWNLSPANPRLLAALVAGLVAWRTRSPLLTIAAGMAVLFAVQYLIHSGF